LQAGAVMLVMPCHDASIPAAGVKLVTVSRERGVQAVYWLLDPSNAALLAMLEANYMTDLRTAATSAVATAMLARDDAATLGIFGTGRIARAHATVLPLVREFNRVLVCGSSREKSEKFAQEWRDGHGLSAEAVDAERCARESDVLCTCTTSPKPVLRGEWVRPGTHINAAGAFQPHTREVDDATVARARVVVDTYDGALGEAGDLLIPLQSGIIGREQVVADLHELVSGRKSGRRNAQEITLFKSLGCGLEDLVAAELVVTRGNW
jgi:ornithine cyclodeaminase/alanine dehydrogenase-like protein (mu-crystallin family)